MTINIDRVMNRIEKIACIGQDPRGGSFRKSFTKEDWQAKELYQRWAKEAGMTADRDDFGNIIISSAGAEPLPPIAMGSHLDTVPNGGRYDGVLGCVAALEVMETVLESGHPLRHPMEAIVFQGEEGARFNSGLIGSRAMVGRLNEQELDKLRDGDGTTLRQAMVELGLQPEKFSSVNRSGRPPAFYLELHIEQGGVLDQAEIPVGVVSGIAGINRYTVTVVGQANHAGTTPFELRQDAMAGAAKMIVASDRIGRQNSRQSTRVTIGTITAEPAAVNVIAGKVTVSLEIRDTETAAIDHCYKQIKTAIEKIAADEKLQLSVVSDSQGALPAATDPGIVLTMRQQADKWQIPHMLLASGAGHDAQSMAAITPIGMLFVRSIGGVSHSPDEYSRPEDIACGIELLYRSVLALD